jgi:hypothetical protein
VRDRAQLLADLDAQSVHRRPIQADGADRAVDLEPHELRHLLSFPSTISTTA